MHDQQCVIDFGYHTASTTARFEPRMSALLLDALSLRQQLSNAPHAVRLLDCRAKLQAPEWGRQQYLNGHIPGAIHADLEFELSGTIIPGQTGRHPLPEPATLAGTFARYGIGPDTQVVAYDDAGGAYAARLWWLLRWLGHDHCALLDGGLPAWIEANLPLQRGEETVTSTPFIGELQANLTVTAQALLAPRDLTIIDVRGPARYAGIEEPIDPVAGHIPGAINLPFANNLAANGRFLPAAELRERYAAVGTNSVSYCGSGVTACHAIFAMTLAGLNPAKLYPGSWSEWITDPSRPIARSPQP